jgi:predicted Ser/Thr protein kinase
MEKIGKYEIVEELGRGGMGIVYKAFDSLMEREVAIKVISEMVLAVPEIKSRFYREARTAGKLSHDNITVIYDVGEDKGRPYIVMEYLTGKDLGTILESGDPLTIEQKLHYAAQICRGLSFSHSNGIIHRDIKPGNIRITGSGKVKIMDFGIARAESSNLTRTGAIIGTPYYMSPEQVQGKKIDKRSDIFSFGVLFYELLTGKKPFPGDEPTGVMYKIVYEEPEELAGTMIGHHRGLRQIVAKLLAKDPDQRYQDLADAGVEIENIRTQLKSGEWKKVEERRRKIEKLLIESRGFLKGNKFKKAREAVDRAAQLDPADTELGRVKKEIDDAETRESRRVLVQERLLESRKALSAKQYERALQLLRQALDVEPANAQALQMTREAEDAIAFARTGETAFAKTRLADTPIPRQKETAQPAVQKHTLTHVTPDRESRVGPAPSKTKLYIIVGAIMLAVAGGLVYRFVLYVPPSPQGFIALNVLPWGEITKITDARGAEVSLGKHVVTPCRLALPPGTFAIALSNPSFEQQLIVNVTVKQDETQEIRKSFTGFDIDKVLSTFQTE